MLRVDQEADRLAIEVCELSSANAAWVYATDRSTELVRLLSTYKAPPARRRAAELDSEAERFVLDIVRGAPEADAASPGVFADGNYRAVSLMCGRQVRAVLVVHRAGHWPPPLSEKQRLLSLGSRASLALENLLVHQVQQEILNKLHQLEAHRTDYVAMVSHELRTPLTSIKGFAQLLTRSGDTSPMVRRYVETIGLEADRLARIVEDVLDLTRMETGLLKLRHEPLCPADLVRGVVQSLEPLAPRERLKVTLPERLPAVRGDAQRLRQALRRLIIDALARACPDTPVLVEAEATAQGVCVRLQYCVDQEQIDNLAQAMENPGQESADGNTTRLGRGGLHLYVSRNFIEAHGSKLWLDRPSEGVARLTFTVRY